MVSVEVGLMESRSGLQDEALLKGSIKSMLWMPSTSTTALTSPSS